MKNTIKTAISFSAALCVGLGLTSSVAADTLYVPDAIFDGASAKLIKGKAVLVSHGKIKAIDAPQKLQGEGVEVIDLSGHTLMPGLIELHSHVLLHPYDEVNWNDQVLKESYAERAIRAANHLKAHLKAGYTTLRDLGSEGAGYTDVGVKQALKKGVIEGPRLIVAGKAIVATGSYGPKGFGEHVTVPLGAEEADGADLVRVVRDQIGHGADFIKIYADYRWGPKGQSMPTFSVDEIKTVVAVARSSGRYVVAHASTPEAMRRATLGGVKTIEHGSQGTYETFKLMKSRSVAWCPTLAAGEAISGYRGWVKGEGEEPLRVTQQKAAFKAALKAGVQMCAGSDVGVFDHGDSAWELELMVDYGMTPYQVLKSATSINAALLEMGDEIGRVKVGYLAEMIAVKGNPLEDIRILRQPSMVVQGEVTLKGDQ